MVAAAGLILWIVFSLFLVITITLAIIIRNESFAKIIGAIGGMIIFPLWLAALIVTIKEENSRKASGQGLGPSGISAIIINSILGMIVFASFLILFIELLPFIGVFFGMMIQ